MSAKYLFLDIDGTLVDFDCRMPESTKTALLEAQKNGHKLIICTGRCMCQIYPWLLEAIPFDGIITSSGARIRWGEETVYQKLFTTEQLTWLMSCFAATHTSSYGHTDSALISTEADMVGVYEVFRNIGTPKDAVDSLLGDITLAPSMVTDGIERMVYCGSALKHDEMLQLIGPEFTIDPYCFKGMPDTSGELNLAGVTKASGIEALTAYLGIGMEDTISFGDNWNDITMIKATAVSVLMGNAPEALKPEADMVTDHINDNGIYNAFKRLSLI